MAAACPALTRMTGHQQATLVPLLQLDQPMLKAVLHVLWHLA